MAPNAQERGIIQQRILAKLDVIECRLGEVKTEVAVVQSKVDTFTGYFKGNGEPGVFERLGKLERYRARTEGIKIGRKSVSKSFLTIAGLLVAAAGATLGAIFG